MYPGIELRLMRYVVAIAEELHFSRAADKLHVSQPSLSKQIRELEDELGIGLFDRTKRQVRLTRAGEAFVKEAQEALLHSQRAVHVAKAANGPETFNLGYSPFVNPRMIGMVRVIPADAVGGKPIELVSAFTGMQLERILTGEMDAGLVLLPVMVPKVVVRPLTSELLQVVLPANHPLAFYQSPRLTDLQQSSCITIGRQSHPALHAQISNRCAEHGLNLHIVQDVTSFSEAASMVAEGLGFAFARAWHERLVHPGIVFKSIQGNPLEIETGIAYRESAQCEVVDKLVSVLEWRMEPRDLAIPIPKTDSSRMVA